MIIQEVETISVKTVQCAFIFKKTSLILKHMHVKYKE